MALLNPPNVLPYATRVVVETVGSTSRPYSHAGLVAALSPGEVGGENRYQARNTVDACRELGLLRRGSDDVVSLVDPDDHALARDGGDAWADRVRRAAFALHTEDDVFEVLAEDASARTSGAKDFIRGITWLLAQDALSQSITVERMFALQRDQFGSSRGRDDWAVVNDEQWLPLLRWGLAMGLLASYPDGPRPVPTAALRSLVRNMRAGRYPASAFCTRVAAEIPVLWRGRHREDLVGRLEGGGDPDPDVAAGWMDSSVAIALRALEAEGRVVLDPGADADDRIPVHTGGGRTMMVSYVEVTR